MNIPSLYHFSKHKVDLNICQYEQVFDVKPYGLWLSHENGNGWSLWCETEGFRVQSLQHMHEAVLKDDAKIIVIRTTNDIKTFTDKYYNEEHGTIDWRKVSKKYDGIFIDEFSRMKSLSLSDMKYKWYKYVDCDSACIWNTNVIKSFSHVLQCF